VGATRIMVIRHAEKPGHYHGAHYEGVRADGQPDAKSLVTLGWERAGGLVTLFAPPLGPRMPLLSTPDFLFAADPEDKGHAGRGNGADYEPSQRPYQTLTALARRLGLSIDAKGKKARFKEMADAALACAGVVLIAWQHQDIPQIGHHILKHTDTPALSLPGAWPGERYDLVWVFDRPAGTGPIVSFHQVPQLLLAGDRDSVIPVAP
jgi:hypothetical protein